MSSVWLILLFYCIVYQTLGFPPNDIPAESRTQSHNSITLEAIFRTTAVFLDKLGLVNNTGLPPAQKVQAFFGTDQESYLNYLRIITRIIGYENDIQRDFANVSFYHVNGEQIAIAHNYIRNLRQTIKGLSTTATTDDIEQIREKVGAALYTIQEFYSNTNWVELRRNSIYEDFGQDSVTLIEVADLQENTCSDCAFLEGLIICDNNIVTDKLTSGYKSGQDVTKPVRQGISGKCSHGSSDDDSRFMTATGGIYKGRSVQSEAPRSILHAAASEAAINASQYFLIGQGRGLLSLMGEEVFRDVFGIRTREDIVKTSLTFVIDVTGSMGDDIKAVIKATQKIVYEAKDSQFVPENYILVTFSDPASLTTGRQTDNPEVMINWLKNLAVTGGGDCPEYAMTGMLKGIEMSNKNSKIYLCTDADAKDEYLQDRVIEGLRAKSLTPVFLLTGQCSSRRKRDIIDLEQSPIPDTMLPSETNLFHRVKRSSLQVFEAIAKETGGRVYETKVAQLETIVEKEIKDTFPSSNVFITWFVIPANSASNVVMSIPVDNHMETLKIDARIVINQFEFTLSYPNGTNVMFSSEKEKQNILDSTLTISIQDPGPGIWKFEKNTLSAWIVNVTAQSPMDFSTSILEPSSDGNFYQLSGNPIKGYNYTLVVDIQNLDSNSSCTSVGLLDRNGTEVAEVPVRRLDIASITRCIGEFVPLNKSSYAQLRGEDALGNEFLRTRMFTILPASVQLRVYPVLGQLRLNESTNITFTLTNTGDSSVNFMITVSNGKTNITVQPGNLSAGEIYTAVAMVTPDSLQPIVLEWTVTLENYTGIIQSERRRYSVADTRTADCIVLKYPERCPVQSLNTGNCSSYNWTGLVQVSSATIWLSEISVSSDEVMLEHMNISEANFSLPIAISGACCIQAVVLTITDNDGKFDRCNFILSEQPLSVVQETTTVGTTAVEVQTTTTATSVDAKEQTAVNWTLIGIVVGSSVAGIILIALLVVLIYKTKRGSRAEDKIMLSHR
ncbi:von Willebrand factor A domain-containing protein 7-like [Saccostrea cucullata]|uniref:von Willebrand factor A domain-containing protein 7-like n=1 Tax=Saccostrea cuccullata TaxID=36930 RepID=UPI002ED5F0DF